MRFVAKNPQCWDGILKMFGALWDAEVTVDSPYDPKNEAIRNDG